MKKLKIIIPFLLVIGICIVPYANAITISKESTSKNPFLSKSSGDKWPTFQNNAARTGFSECPMPDTFEILWTNDEYYDLDDNSPIIYQDKLYVCSLYGDVYCLDAYSGDEIWRIDTGDENWITGVPTAYNDKLYICIDKDMGDYDIGELHCYDAFSGDKLWKFTTQYPFDEQSAIVDNGKVYFASDKIYCLDAEHGDEIWNYEPEEDQWYHYTSPAISNGQLLIGISEKKEVYCFDSENGELIWTHKVDGAASTPSIYKDMVYFGTSSGTIYCLDLYYGYGDEIWVKPTYHAITASPAAAYDKIYIGSDSRESGMFYCLNAYSGDEIWSYQTPIAYYGYEPIRSSAAIADEKVFFGGAGSDHSLYPQAFIYCLDAESGEELLKYQTGSLVGANAGIESSPAISNGVVYFTVRGGDKYIYAFSGEIKGPSKPSIEGPRTGGGGVEYYYSFTSIDVDGEKLRYYVDWGDGETTGWTESYASGEPCKLHHAWDSLNCYTIKAKAKNSDGEESDWGELEITIPRIKSQDNLFEILLNNFMRLLPRYVSFNFK